MADLWPFLGALALVYLLPGADMLLVLDTAAARGRSQALAVAAGLAAARALHVALAGLGLAALLAAWPWALALASALGAGYLAWLALQILRAPLLPRPGGPGAAAGSSRAGGWAFAAFRRGLLTNLLNPKALLFCSLLLPQFLMPQQGAVALQLLLLGVVLVGAGLAFDGLYALAGDRLGPWLAARPALQRAQRRLFAALLFAFALRLVVPPGGW